MWGTANNAKTTPLPANHTPRAPTLSRKLEHHWTSWKKQNRNHERGAPRQNRTAVLAHGDSREGCPVTIINRAQQTIPEALTTSQKEAEKN
jgi:hypothetical protein